MLPAFRASGMHQRDGDVYKRQLTEFLPVSSSGHLSVVQHVTGVNGEAALVLSLVLHLGTLAAVFVAFWGTIWGMIKEFFLTIGDIFTGKFSWKNMNGNRRMMFKMCIRDST